MNVPVSAEQVRDAVRSLPRVVPRGGGTKTALAGPPGDPATLDLSGLAGIVEYRPEEYTVTARAGARVAALAAALAEHGQCLPFDPLLAAAGATLGGTVAAGASGPGRLRFGGVRDFLLEAHFVDGTGALLRGGARVVKNAAGFDLPKLMVGSLGRLGVLVELTFKVFPAPEATATVVREAEDAAEARCLFNGLAGGPLDLEAAELAPPAGLRLRIGGLAGALAARLGRLAAAAGGGQVVAGGDDAALWEEARELAWAPADAELVKVPLTPGRIAALEAEAAIRSRPRRYGAGGQLLLLAWEGHRAALHQLLGRHGLAGLVLRGAPGRPLVGRPLANPFLDRVRAALDPDRRFPGFESGGFDAGGCDAPDSDSASCDAPDRDSAGSGLPGSGE